MTTKKQHDGKQAMPLEPLQPIPHDAEAGDIMAGQSIDEARAAIKSTISGHELGTIKTAEAVRALAGIIRHWTNNRERAAAFIENELPNWRRHFPITEPPMPCPITIAGRQYEQAEALRKIDDIITEAEAARQGIKAAGDVPRHDPIPWQGSAVQLLHLGNLLRAAGFIGDDDWQATQLSRHFMIKGKPIEPGNLRKQKATCSEHPPREEHLADIVEKVKKVTQG